MKTFHVTGTCIPEENYMVDMSHKLDQIMNMIERKEYFVINRPRQYGKTTTLSLLNRRLLSSREYLPIKMSFEGFGSKVFQSEEVFCVRFFRKLRKVITDTDKTLTSFFDEKVLEVEDLDTLSDVLSELIEMIGKKVVLLIDEVDKSTNNALFLDFLGMLRNKYLNTRAGDDTTFHSVILAGVNDIKSLKQKIRPDEKSQLNSPWNIAVDFKVDMSFNPAEIETMLVDYIKETGIQMDTKAISERIYFWTSGYPFLVSKLCKIIVEEILPIQNSAIWDIMIIDQAVRILTKEKNTIFEVIIKNMENYPDLYKLIENIVLGCVDSDFVWQNPLIDLAYMHGFIVRNGGGKARIHNKIFNEMIADYLISKNSTRLLINPISQTQSPYIKPDGHLDFERVLLSFQEVIREKYSNNLLEKTDEFIEKDLRLLFLVYLQPIIKGIGYSFMEVEIGGEKRLDIVVTYADERFVVELKIWDGPAYHEEGKQRLKRYMQTMSINNGYMLIMYKTKLKTFENTVEDGIFMVYV